VPVTAPPQDLEYRLEIVIAGAGVAAVHFVDVHVPDQIE